MKLSVNPIFVLTILILSIATAGTSQENERTPIKNIYKISLSKPFVGQYFLGYERMVSNHFSLNSQIGYLGKAFYFETLSDLNDHSYIRTEKTPRSELFNKRTPTNGFQINLEFRYYPFGLETAFFIGARVVINMLILVMIQK